MSPRAEHSRDLSMSSLGDVLSVSEDEDEEVCLSGEGPQGSDGSKNSDRKVKSKSTRMGMWGNKFRSSSSLSSSSTSSSSLLRREGGGGGTTTKMTQRRLLLASTSDEVEVISDPANTAIDPPTHYQVITEPCEWCLADMPWLTDDDEEEFCSTIMKNQNQQQQSHQQAQQEHHPSASVQDRLRKYHKMQASSPYMSILPLAYWNSRT